MTKPTGPSRQLVDDLERHFAIKLHRLLGDVVGTCMEVDMKTQDIIRIVVTGLMYELVAAMKLGQFNEPDFLQICQRAFQNYHPEIHEEAVRN